MKLLTSFAVAAAVAAAAPNPAAACGGFFCSNQPIDQAGEKIVFSVNGKAVTAAIQIQFAGSSEEFSWVLPLPSAPEQEGGMEIGTEELFTRLLQTTSPQFQVNWDPTSACTPYWGNDFAAGGGGGGVDEDGGVQVLQTKEVGPYDASVVKSDDPEALTKWLSANGYDQPDIAKPLIAHYVAQGNVFLALKLQQDKGAGDIAPIVVKFQSDDGACVPLILTQIAAQADMPVYAWILDAGRTVPKNFFHVVLNLAHIDWLGVGWQGAASNYTDVVTKAVNEAEGHGFVTDFAGPSDLMKEQLWWPGRFDQIDTLLTKTEPAEFYNAMLMVGIPVNAQTQALIRKHIPTPPGWDKSDQEFYCCLDQYKSYLDTLPFDAAAFVHDLKKVVVEPAKAAQELLDSRPYLTRLFTTVSPDEMDRDPIFLVDTELPDVPVLRTALGVAQCSEGGKIESVVLTLPDGQIVEYAGPFDPWGPTPGAADGQSGGGSVGEQPYAAEIQAYDSEAKALLNIPFDEVPLRDQELGILGGIAGGMGGSGGGGADAGGAGGAGGSGDAAGGAGGAGGGAGGGGTGSGDAGSSSGSGCQTQSSGSAAGAAGMLLLLGLAARRRRVSVQARSEDRG
ncbi:MAG: hypothetical protein AMXMBFR64_52780 [Myxococcales bacterium]